MATGADQGAEGTTAVHQGTLKAVVRAQREMGNLIRAWYQQHGAEEVVLPMYMLLKPESDGLMDAELDAELDKLA
jgi:hypothetical protein